MAALVSLTSVAGRSAKQSEAGDGGGRAVWRGTRDNIKKKGGGRLHDEKTSSFRKSERTKHKIRSFKWDGTGRRGFVSLCLVARLNHHSYYYSCITHSLVYMDVCIYASTLRMINSNNNKLN